MMKNKQEKQGVNIRAKRERLIINWQEHYH